MGVCAESCRNVRKCVKTTFLVAEAADDAANVEGASRTVPEDEVDKLCTPEALDKDSNAAQDGDAKSHDSNDVVKARDALEARRAVAAWMDVHGVLRRADGELRTILKQGRALAKKADSPIPTLPPPQRSALSALTAEFLDGAALEFHTALQEHVNRNAMLDVGIVHTAMSNTLDFLAAAVPDEDGLACPVDPRAQVIRASLSADPEGVRAMLVQELPRRLESSVTFVCTARLPDRGDVHHASTSNGEAIKVVHEHLATVTERLFRCSS